MCRHVVSPFLSGWQAGTIGERDGVDPSAVWDVGPAAVTGPARNTKPPLACAWGGFV